MKKLKIAITGNIGSGKSSFCKYLTAMNYNVIKADEIAKDLMENDQKIKAQLVKFFGESTYINGKLNTEYLAERIFSTPENLNKINRLVHPAVIKKVNLLMNSTLKYSDIVFHEAALIYEAEMEHLFDMVILITADYDKRLSRKIVGDKYSEEEFAKRDSSQIPEEEKIKCADFVFSNNGTFDDLKNKAELLIKILKAMISN